MWLGSEKNIKSKILDFESSADPVKALETFLTLQKEKNLEANFLSHQNPRNETEINLWLRRDLTLYGRGKVLLAETFGVSHELAYVAFMLSVPDSVTKLFKQSYFPLTSHAPVL